MERSKCDAPTKRAFQEIDGTDSSGDSNECPFSRLIKRQKTDDNSTLENTDINNSSFITSPFDDTISVDNIKVEQEEEDTLSEYGANFMESVVSENEQQESDSGEFDVKSVESPVYFDDDEADIDDILEADIDEIQEKERGEYTVCEKTVLKRRPKDLFNILPDNWVEATHDSGLIVYLHKSSRVCTFSRPYYIGPGSVRHHKVPPSAIPCLYQKKLAEEEESNLKAQQEHQEKLAREADTNKKSAVMSEINAPFIKIRESKDVAAEDLSSEDLHQYATKAFEFKTISFRRYKEWKKARKHFKDIKKLNSDKTNLLKNFERPMLPSDTKLITVPSMEVNNKPTTREFCLNPRGKTALTILHEYVQKVLKSSVEYDIFESTDPINPYHSIAKMKSTSTSSAIISGSSFRERLNVIQEEYKVRLVHSGKSDQVEKLKDITVIGRGSGKSKRVAKIDAATSAVRLLIPEIELNNDGIALQNVGNEEKELELFDLLDIEDSKISEYSHRIGQPQPFLILQECLAKSAPLNDCQLVPETQKIGHSKIEYRLKLGDKYEVVAIAPSANEGKQLAAQKMLKKIYPQFQKYGSLLRLYGAHVKQSLKDLKKEQRDFQSKNTTSSGHLKSSKRVSKNPEFVNAVREHMLKFAARAKPKSSDLIYSTAPLPQDQVKEFEQQCKEQAEKEGDKFWNRIPRL